MWNIKPCVFFKARRNVRATSATRMIQVFFPREQVRKTRWRSDSDPRYFSAAGFFRSFLFALRAVDDPNYAYRKLALRVLPLDPSFISSPPVIELETTFEVNSTWPRGHVYSWQKARASVAYILGDSKTPPSSRPDANDEPPPPPPPQIFIARSFLPSLSF